MACACSCFGLLFVRTNAVTDSSRGHHLNALDMAIKVLSLSGAISTLSDHERPDITIGRFAAQPSCLQAMRCSALDSARFCHALGHSNDNACEFCMPRLIVACVLREMSAFRLFCSGTHRCFKTECMSRTELYKVSSLALLVFTPHGNYIQAST